MGRSTPQLADRSGGEGMAAGMRILFLTHYFPPEVNAPANRTFEHCREWVREGHEVHVITCFPSHPRGEVFEGHRLRWYSREVMDGIHVHRVLTYIAANSGVLRRSLNYLSFVPASVYRGLRLARFDWIIATSPQFMVAVAGGILGCLKRTPWVFELRDLWPDSLAAVGALERSVAMRLLEHLELGLYRHASLVVAVTRAFMDNLESRGIPRRKICYVPNGMYTEEWDLGDGRALRRRLGIAPGAVVVSYVGTVGMAHGLGTLLRAAELLSESLHILIVGDGAERDSLESAARKSGLDNVHFLGLLPREEIPDVYAASDIAAVLLRDRAVFRTVIPSKLLEGMAAGLPIVCGVRGEAEAIVRDADAGIVIEPENAGELAAAISELAQSAEHRLRLGRAGKRHVAAHFSRRRWAEKMIRELASRAT